MKSAQLKISEKNAVEYRTSPNISTGKLELMARGGMRVGEVFSLTPVDIQERTLAIQKPKSGRTGEAVYVQRKLLVILSDYVRIQSQQTGNQKELLQ